MDKLQGSRRGCFLLRSSVMAAALDFHASPLIRLISCVQTRLNASMACTSVNSVPDGSSGVMSSVRLAKLLVFHQRIDPPHRVRRSDDLVFGTENEKETMAGISQAAFVNQPRRGRCEITGSDTQRFECFLPGEVAPPVSKTIVKVPL